LTNLSPFLENTDRSQLKAYETELATLRAGFSDAHPDIIKLKAAIGALKIKISQNGTQQDLDPAEPDNPAYITLASQLAGTQSDILSVKNQLKELGRAKARYETRIEKTPKVEREYHALTSEQVNLRVKFNDLMQKFMEAKVAHGLEKDQKGERFTLIDPPRLPERAVKPNRLAIMVIGVVLGIGAGVGWAALREFADQSVRSSDKLFAFTGLPVLGGIPDIVTGQDRRRRRIRRIVAVTATCLLIVTAVFVFHTWIMDLNVFWAKLNRKLML
jgi:uncharacterized protein involved in exopolysaccharide biosynthesis